MSFDNFIKLLVVSVVFPIICIKDVSTVFSLSSEFGSNRDMSLCMRTFLSTRTVQPALYHLTDHSNMTWHNKLNKQLTATDNKTACVKYGLLESCIHSVSCSHSKQPDK